MEHYLNNELSDWLSEFSELNPDAVKSEDKPNKKTNSFSTKELHALDFCNKDFYENLSEDDKEKIQFWPLMRLLSASNNDADHYLLIVNDLVNDNFNSLKNHPILKWKLLAICGTNKKQYHYWIKPPRGVVKNKLEEEFTILFPYLKYDDIELLLKINTKKEIEQFFKDNGYDDKTIVKLLK